jgi:hypothetical protein
MMYTMYQERPFPPTDYRVQSIYSITVRLTVTRKYLRHYTDILSSENCINKMYANCNTIFIAAPCILKLLITHTNKCIFYNIMKSKIQIKTFKMLLHVSIFTSSSGSIQCSLLKLYIKTISELLRYINTVITSQCTLPEDDVRIETCRSVLNVLV